MKLIKRVREGKAYDAFINFKYESCDGRWLCRLGLNFPLAIKRTKELLIKFIFDSSRQGIDYGIIEDEKTLKWGHILKV